MISDSSPVSAGNLKAVVDIIAGGGVISASVVTATCQASLSSHGMATVKMDVSAVRPTDFSASGKVVTISRAGTYRIDVANVNFWADPTNAGGNEGNFSGDAELVVSADTDATISCYEGLSVTMELAVGDTIEPETYFRALSSDRGNVGMTLVFQLSRIR